ncbi:hypothetical protein [Microbacterium sp. Root61]|uniref:hypothetical protein n=1 Tax=Microbacterium sp. Root61 TaxID=1736570 RepID=UPI0012E3B660|nr:hypothetical protein [Microbacterium sp. Root61]
MVPLVGETFDFTGITGALPALVVAVVAAAGLVLTAALGVMGAFWGFPKLIGLFKRTAK